MPIIDVLTLDPDKVARLSVLQGWLRRDLAEATGLSTGPIASAFKNRPVSPRTAKKIADALGTTIKNLITETPEN